MKKLFVTIYLTFISHLTYGFIDCHGCKDGERILSASLFGSRLKAEKYYFHSFELVALHLPVLTKHNFALFDISFRMPIGYPIDVLTGPRVEFPGTPYTVSIVSESTFSLSTISLNQAMGIHTIGLGIPIKTFPHSKIEILGFQKWKIPILNYIDGPYYNQHFGLYFGLKSSGFFNQ